MFLPSLLSWLICKGDPLMLLTFRNELVFPQLALRYQDELQKTAAEQEFTDFTVYPFGRTLAARAKQGELIKEELIYTIMFKQPAHHWRDAMKKALEQVRVKKPNPLRRDLLSLKKWRKDRVLLCCHLGPFDQEPQLFAKMIPFSRITSWYGFHTLIGKSISQ